jgi:hypothetical protein
MDMRRLLSGLQQGGAGAMPADGPAVDTAETVHISSLALLKMLKHGTYYYSPRISAAGYRLTLLI